MIKFYFTILLSLCLYSGYSQSGPHLFSGTNHFANGQIGILLDNAEAAIVLPALLVDLDKRGWTAGAALRTGIEDLVELAAAAHLRLPWKDQVALGIQHTGIEGYSEQRITFSYSRKLFQKLNAGLQFDLNRNSAEEYKDLYGISWSLSMHAPLMKSLSMAASLYNPLGNAGMLNLPSVARFGLLYSPSEKLGIAMEAEKDWRYELSLKAGIHYKLHPRVAFLWGVGIEPSLIHAGMRWHLSRQMAISGGWRYHNQLGSSLSASLSQNHCE